MAIQFEASSSANSQITATVGFLDAQIKDGDSDDSSKQSQFSASFLVEVQDAGVAFDLSANADVYLQIDAGFGASFPSIGADFEMHWFGPEAGHPEPTLDFNDVRVNLGTFLSGLVAPLVETSEIVLAPMSPLVDFLKAPLPVISDLAEAIGLGEVSIRDIADLLAPALGPGYSELAEMAVTAGRRG